MNDLGLFNLGFDRGRWLAAKASTIAGNVANADTPGFHARHVVPFEQFLAMRNGAPDRAQDDHVGVAETAMRMVQDTTEEAKLSGNDVSLEDEMAALGQTRAEQSTAATIISAFNRMLQSSIKAGQP